VRDDCFETLRAIPFASVRDREAWP
jgi:hypothetical protein